MSLDKAVGLATDARLLKRGCESLIGICSGLIADGELNNKEIAFLSTWLAENEAIAKTWPCEVIYSRVREVLSDGVVSDTERKYLVETLESLVGGSFSETGAIAAGSTTLPLSNDVSIEIAGQTFCFTGEFLFGTRAACTRAIESRGGLATSTITKNTDYLVVGELASRSWKNTSHGTKIESAVQLQSKGDPIQIVSEAAWVRALA